MQNNSKKLKIENAHPLCSSPSIGEVRRGMGRGVSTFSLGFALTHTSPNPSS